MLCIFLAIKVYFPHILFITFRFLWIYVWLCYYYLFVRNQVYPFVCKLESVKWKFFELNKAFYREQIIIILRFKYGHLNLDLSENSNLMNILNILTTFPPNFLSSIVLALLFHHWIISSQILVTYWDIKEALLLTEVTVRDIVSLRTWYSVHSNLFAPVSTPSSVSKNILFEWGNK